MGGGTVAGFLKGGLDAERTVRLEFDGTPAEGFNPLHDAQRFWAEIFHGVIIGGLGRLLPLRHEQIHQAQAHGLQLRLREAMLC